MKTENKSALPRISNAGRILRSIAAAKLDGTTPQQAAQKLYAGMPWIPQHFEKANEVSGDKPRTEECTALAKCQGGTASEPKSRRNLADTEGNVFYPFGEARLLSCWGDGGVYGACSGRCGGNQLVGG